MCVYASVCLCVPVCLCAHICVCMCQQRPEERIRAPGARVTDDGELSCVLLDLFSYCQEGVNNARALSYWWVCFLLRENWQIPTLGSFVIAAKAAAAMSAVVIAATSMEVISPSVKGSNRTSVRSIVR